MKGHRAPGPTSGHLVHDLGQPGGCTRPRSQGSQGMGVATGAWADNCSLFQIITRNSRQIGQDSLFP